MHPCGNTCGLFTLSVKAEVSPLVSTMGYTYTKPINESISTFHHSEIVLILQTSGTSGNKKVVPYNLDTILIGVACIILSWGLKRDDICLNMMPLFHIGGIARNVLSPILAGGATIPCGSFDASLFWDLLGSKMFTWYYASPTMHHAILLESTRVNTPLPVETVRFLANAAGGLLPVLAESLKNTFACTILTSYGMTEW